MYKVISGISIEFVFWKYATLKQFPAQAIRCRMKFSKELTKVAFLGDKTVRRKI